MRMFLAVCLAVVTLGVACACSSNAREETPAPAETEVVEQVDAVEPEPFPTSLKFGELVSAIESENDAGRVLVVKGDVDANLTNSTTIKQNYMNAIDLIQNQGADAFDQFQYWAIAPARDGSEVKYISFKLNKDAIQGVKNGNILLTDFENYVDDLWILPSLQ